LSFSEAKTTRDSLLKIRRRLVKAINDTRRIFVTITSWEGIGAVRIAVSNWRTANGEGGVEASSELVEVKGVLSEVMQ